MFWYQFILVVFATTDSAINNQDSNDSENTSGSDSESDSMADSDADSDDYEGYYDGDYDHHRGGWGSYGRCFNCGRCNIL